MNENPSIPTKTTTNQPINQPTNQPTSFPMPLTLAEAEAAFQPFRDVTNITTNPGEDYKVDEVIINVPGCDDRIRAVVQLFPVSSGAYQLRSCWVRYEVARVTRSAIYWRTGPEIKSFFKLTGYKGANAAHSCHGVLVHPGLKRNPDLATKRVLATVVRAVRFYRPDIDPMVAILHHFQPRMSVVDSIRLMV
jgi:hypothetical protein